MMGTTCTDREMASRRLAQVKLVGQHQVEGCNWMLDKEILPVSDGLPRGGILADEVGLGKTYMAAGVIRANPVPLTLIVTLVNVKMQWCTILRHFANRMANQIPDYFHPENLNPAYFRQMHEDARTRGQKVLATSSSDDESVIIISTTPRCARAQSGLQMSFGIVSF